MSAADRLAPPGSTRLERAVDAAMAARMSAIGVPLKDLWRPSRCPPEFLPWLAWSLSVDSWSPDWPNSVKRAVIRQAIPTARRRGTVQSVREAVAAYGAQMSLREWHEMDPPGPPHTFDLVLTVPPTGGEAATAAFVEAVIQDVIRTKPARAHFTVTQGLYAQAAVGLQGAGRASLYRRLKLEEAA